MKTGSFKYITVALALGTVLTASLIVAAQNNGTTPEITVVGYISDSTCGLKHMSGMGDDKNCTLACVKGGAKFVFGDRDHKKVYQLDQDGQDKAKEFAGQKVKVTGTLSGKTISVTSIEAAN